MRAGRRSMISSSARCSTAGGAPRSPRPSGSAGAHSRSRRRHWDFSAGLFAHESAGRRRSVGADAAQGAARVAEQALSNVEALAVMDAERLGLARPVLRCGGGAIRHHRGAASGSDARRICARDPPGRRDRPGQSHRRRAGPRAAVRALFCAACAPARLAAGIPLSDAVRMGRAPWRRAGYRATRHAAVGAFFPDPLRTPARRARSRNSRRAKPITCSCSSLQDARATRERAMVRHIRILGLPVSALLLPTVVASTCPSSATNKNAGFTQGRATRARCLHDSDTQTTVGKGGEVRRARQDGKGNLSDKLARSGGVICPPEHVDSEIKQPTPPGGTMPVIPPPGSPGGDPRYSAEITVGERLCRPLA